MLGELTEAQKDERSVFPYMRVLASHLLSCVFNSEQKGAFVFEGETH